jgi:hypothetical protein
MDDAPGFGESVDGGLQGGVVGGENARAVLGGGEPWEEEGEEGEERENSGFHDYQVIVFSVIDSWLLISQSGRGFRRRKGRIVVIVSDLIGKQRIRQARRRTGTEGNKGREGLSLECVEAGEGDDYDYDYE